MSTHNSTASDPGETARMAAMLEEDEKGSTRVRRDGRGQVVFGEDGQPIMDKTPPSRKPTPSPRDVAEQRARREFVHGVLGSMAGSSELRTGEALDAADREEFVSAALEDVGRVPASVKAQLATELGKIVDQVASGDRGNAVEYARNRSVEIAGSLPRSFKIPEDEFDVKAALDAIPRA